MIRLAHDLHLPPDAVTQTFAILAMRGSGKTYTATVMAEQMIRAGAAVVILDPVGVWWGLRSNAEGDGPGLPVVIFGGDHGDLPLEAAAGELVAGVAVASRQPMVLDLSHLSKSGQRRFVADFAETLYQQNRAPLHLVLDEADMFAPQRPQPGEQRMVGAIDTLVRRGRTHGLGVTMISQRPAVIAKDVLTQASVLLALRLVGATDRAAIRAWISASAEDNEQAKVLLASLPSLEIGEAWVWSPGWLRLCQRARIGRRTTFDSSSTPTSDSGKSPGPAMAPVDLVELRAKMATLAAGARGGAPASSSALEAEVVALRARVTELEGHLAASRKSTVEARGVAHHYASALRRARREADLGLEVPIPDAWMPAPSTSAAVPATTSPALLLRPAAPAAGDPPPRAAAVKPSAPASEAAAPERGPSADLKLPPGERDILAVLARDGSLMRPRLAVRTLYAAKGGGFTNLLSSLRVKGLITGSICLEITSAGLAMNPGAPRAALGEELVEAWMKKDLSKAARCSLKALSAVYPKRISKSEVAERAGYQVKGGGFGNGLSELRSVALIEGFRTIQASDALGLGATR